MARLSVQSRRMNFGSFSRNMKPRLRNSSASMGDWVRICERMSVSRPKMLHFSSPSSLIRTRLTVNLRALSWTMVSCVTLLKLLRQKSKIVLLSLCFAFIEVILYIWIKIFAFYQTNYTHQIIISTFNPQHHIYDRLFNHHGLFFTASSTFYLHRITVHLHLVREGWAYTNQYRAWQRFSAA